MSHKDILNVGKAACLSAETSPKAGSTPYMLACIFIAAIAVRAICYVGMSGGDDYRYVQAAGSVLDGHYPWRDDPLVYIRTAQVFSLVPLVWAFGHSTWAPGLLGVLYTAGLMIVAWAVAVRLAGPRAATWTLAVLAFSTVAILYGTQALPDMPLAFWTALAVLLAMRAGDTAPRRRAWLFFAAGACLGVGWLVKFTALFVAPVVAYVVLRGKHRLRGLALLAGGFAVVFAAEMAFWAALGEHPLTHLLALGGYVAKVNAGGGGDYTRTQFGQYFVKMFLIISDDGLFYYLLAGAMAWALLRRRRELLLAALWVLVVFAAMQFGSRGISRFRPFPRNPRYLMPLIVPAAVMIGAALAALSIKRRRLAAGVFAVYAASSLLLAYVAVPTLHTDTVAAEQAMAILRGERATVYSDQTFVPLLDYVSRDGDRSSAPRKWLDNRLVPVVELSKHPGAYVVRYDPRVERVAAGHDGDVSGLDKRYEWLEANTVATRVRLSYGDRQRALLGGIWRALRAMPLPDAAKSRLAGSFDRHLTEPIIVIYRVRPALAERDAGNQTHTTGTP